MKAGSKAHSFAPGLWRIIVKKAGWLKEKPSASDEYAGILDMPGSAA